MALRAKEEDEFHVGELAVHEHPVEGQALHSGAGQQGPLLLRMRDRINAVGRSGDRPVLRQVDGDGPVNDLQRARAHAHRRSLAVGPGSRVAHTSCPSATKWTISPRTTAR
jgi:hypothetical protein